MQGRPRGQMRWVRDSCWTYSISILQISHLNILESERFLLRTLFKKHRKKISVMGRFFTFNIKSEKYVCYSERLCLLLQHWSNFENWKSQNFWGTRRLDQKAVACRNEVCTGRKIKKGMWAVSLPTREVWSTNIQILMEHRTSWD